MFAQPSTQYISELLTQIREQANDESVVGPYLTKQAAQALLWYFDNLLEKDPEAFRREHPSVDTAPVPALMLDYASAGTQIDKAMAHLNEGLPGGQKRRCETSYALLHRGVQELGVWMRARGYEV